MYELGQIVVIAFMFSVLNRNEWDIFYFYRHWLENSGLPDWLTNPLGLCYKCFTGQVCLWYYLFAHSADYNLIDHLSFTAGGIFISMILFRLYNYLDTFYE